MCGDGVEFAVNGLTRTGNVEEKRNAVGTTNERVIEEGTVGTDERSVAGED